MTADEAVKQTPTTAMRFNVADLALMHELVVGEIGELAPDLPDLVPPEDETAEERANRLAHEDRLIARMYRLQQLRRRYLTAMRRLGA